MTGNEQKSGIVRTLIDNSFLLIAGAVDGIDLGEHGIATSPRNLPPANWIHRLLLRPAIPDL